MKLKKLLARLDNQTKERIIKIVVDLIKSSLEKTFYGSDYQRIKEEDFIKRNLDPSTKQEFGEGVGDYKYKVVYKLKDGNYYYFEDTEEHEGSGGKSSEKLSKIDKSKIRWNKKPDYNWQKGAHSSTKERENNGK